MSWENWEYQTDDHYTHPEYWMFRDTDGWELVTILKIKGNATTVWRCYYKRRVK